MGRVAEFDADNRKALTIGDREVMVLRFRDRFYAFENHCLHMGGPVGEGRLVGKVESVIEPDGTWQGDRFSSERVHLVCPWHGWEYDVTTGEFAGDCRLRLRRYEVVQRGDEVYVLGGG